jgi:quinoprotein glucose dehydrogenase
VLTTTKGKNITGIIKAEDKENLTLMTPEANLVTVAKKDIEERQAGKSAMPEDLVKHLTLFELRDLVEYLASLK